MFSQVSAVQLSVGVPHPLMGWEGTQSSPDEGYPILPNFGGTPILPDGGIPGVPTLIRTGWGTPCQDWMGVPPYITGWGYPLLGDRTTWRAACLLRSRRRAFLLSHLFLFSSLVANTRNWTHLTILTSLLQ